MPAKYYINDLQVTRKKKYFPNMLHDNNLDSLTSRLNITNNILQ